MPRTQGSSAASRRPPDVVAPALTESGRLSRVQFEQMTAELSDRLFATALRLTRNRADAEDLVQDTMFRAWRSLKTFQAGSLFRAWLFRILRNAFLNRIRHEAMAPKATDPEFLNPSAPKEVIPDIRALGEVPAIADRHFDDRVKQAVDTLPEVYRVPFLLFTLGDFTYEEIAKALDVPMGTVMSRLHRARAQLRERLTEYAAEVRIVEVRVDGGSA